MNLAGNELKATTDFDGDKLYGYAIIPLPHCASQSGSETPNPFPSELLNAPIVITIALKRQADIINVASTSVGTLPTAFDDAYLQVRQVNPLDRGMMLAISPSVSYAFPCVFYQQVNSVSLANTADDQEVVLTGFRAGSVKGLHVWMVDTSDTINPNAFVLPRDLELSYAGNVIHKYKGVSSQMLDTLFTDVPSYFDNSILTAPTAPGGPWTSADTVSSWVHFPLAQRFEQLSAEYTVCSGLGISNGVMNLRLKTPSAKTTYRLYYTPYYDCAIMFNNGNAEYVF